MRRTFAPATATAVLALLASGGMAQAQGSINVYNWSDYIAPGLIERFTAETGIAVNYDVFDSNDTLEARMFAGGSGFDVVVPTSDYMQRQIAAGIYQPLNRELLPNWQYLDENAAELFSRYDEGNAHSVVYMMITTGIGYNVQAVAERMGADYVVDSWDILFNPEIAARFQDCGIAWLDAHTEVLPAAMNYIGRDPASTDEADFTAAAEMLAQVRPFVRYFHSSQYISDLANGEICIAIGWSGDVLQAGDRAEEAGNGIEVSYAIPDQGVQLAADMLVIPTDAPNPAGAHAFINFLMDPQVAAENTNFIMFPNGVSASREFIDEEVLNDPRVYPSAEAAEHFWVIPPYDARADRAATRIWTRLRTGQ